MIRAFSAADPLQPPREAACRRFAKERPARGVLHLMHHHGGGTETHVRELIDAARESWRHYLAIAVGDRWQVEEHRQDGSVGVSEFAKGGRESWHDFLDRVCATFRVSLIHVHNLSACREGVLEALDDGSIPFGYTLHDLNFACPTITLLDAAGRYCGGETDTAACNRCLAAQPPFAGVEIEHWRGQHARLVRRACFLIAPSRWVAAMFERYFPDAAVTLIAHGTQAPRVRRCADARLAVVMPDDGVATVAVLGAVGPDKGARRIERLVESIRERRLALRVVVIGYLDVERGPWQADDARLTVHGRYQPEDLPDLLAHYRVSLAIYPSAGPETFSYTLSEAWRAGMPVLVPPIGALAERVAATGAGWVMTLAEWSDDASMLERIAELTSDDSRGARAAAAAAARAVAHATPAAMAAATLSLYERALPRAKRFGTAPLIEALRARCRGRTVRG